MENTVNIANNKLVLSLPQAKSPVVWQMDLSAYEACAVEVSGTKAPFDLVLKKPDGKSETIAAFESKDDATAVLLQITDALQNGEGNNAPDKSGKCCPVKSSSMRWLMKILLFLIALIVVLFVSAVILSPRPVSYAPDMMQSSAPAQMESGVPLSAKEFLKGK